MARIRGPRFNGDVRAAFTEAIMAQKRTGTFVPRRHPAEVTADRLTDDVTRWTELFDGDERDAVGIVVNALREIAEGQRERA